MYMKRVSLHVARKAVVEAAVVATKQHIIRLCLSLAVAITLFINTAQAAVLPEDRADILYHRYEGGGSIIDGPSILVRKEFADKVSVWGNYYVDMLSSASIDVVTAGSPDGYTEERVETSVGIDYLHDRTIMSASYTSSNEDDYEARTFGLGLSQEFFSDLTTLSINYSQGNDVVKENIYENDRIIQTDTLGEARHQRFGVGLTQILTKKLIVSANVESVVDDGFLNNPYRSVRFRQTTNGVKVWVRKPKYTQPHVTAMPFLFAVCITCHIAPLYDWNGDIIKIAGT